MVVLLENGRKTKLNEPRKNGPSFPISKFGVIIETFESLPISFVLPLPTARCTGLSQTQKL